MKTIVFIRHAKSSWTDYSLNDFDRPLDNRGLRDAPLMAKLLQSKNINPEVIISSPANRALSTARYFGDKFQLNIQNDKALYHGFPENYLDAIAGLNEEVHCVALFGHNPGLTIVANDIKPGSTDNLPTCGIIIATADDKIPWKDLSFDDMHLETILYPKML